MTHSTYEGKDLLTIGDEVVNGVLASLVSLRFAVASDEREREAAFRLRYEAVIERSMADATRFPDGLEYDGYDARALQLLAWEGERPVGTCRLVLPAVDQPLPVEPEFEIEVPTPEYTVELGRMVIERRYRGAGHQVLIGLACRAWLCMRERGLTFVVAATPRKLVQLFQTLGFAVSVLGPPRMHWGEERVPFRCDGVATIPRIRELWTASR